jgi:hypothetical protein
MKLREILIELKTRISNKENVEMIVLQPFDYYDQLKDINNYA